MQSDSNFECENYNNKIIIMRSLLKCVLPIYTMLFLCLAPNAFGIKCWYCQSISDPKCGEPFDNTTLPITDCNPGRGIERSGDLLSNMCLKTRQKVHGVWQITRGCGSRSVVEIRGNEIYNDPFCVKRTGTDGTVTEYCMCDSKDVCNSSYAFSPMPLLLIAIAGLPIFVNLMNL